jgi:ABC-type antimicrobial peptide transport system permease subunit
MSQITSRKRASALSTALLLIGLAIVIFLRAWWPGIVLAIGIPLALRQALLGHYFDTFISLLIFGGVFITAQFEVSWDILLPVLFLVAALYILLREFQESSEHPEDIEDEDLNHELEEKD